MSERTRSARHPSLVRRAMIVNAATSLMADQGLAATSAREIANAAGVSLGTVTYHFSSVDEILVQALSAQTKRFDRKREARLAECTEPLERLIVFLAAYLDPDLHPQVMWRLWLDCWSRARNSQTLQNWQIADYGETYAQIEAMIADGIAQGLLASVDARDCAREFLALVDGLGTQMMVDPELSRDRAMAILDRAVRRQLAVT